MWLCYNDRRVNFLSIPKPLSLIHILIIKAFGETWLMMMRMYHFNHLFFKEIIQVYWNILSWFRNARWKSYFLNVIYKQPVLINSVKVEDYQRIILIKKSVFDLCSRNHVSLLLSPGMILAWGRLTTLMPFPRKGEMENHWKIEARGGRKTTLGQSRRKVAFIQGSFHPLPDCSEEKGNKFQDTDN